jgi:hypothetical protein
MANAIHKTTASDTLASIAGRYYALEGPHGTIRDVELKKVTNAIREATPTALKKFKDADPLPEGTTLFIPTLRELNRVVFSDRTTLLAGLKAHGYEHARKLLRYSADEMIGYLSPLPPDYSAADIRRTWMLTALLNPDGMDLYTAQYLYDTLRIVSLPELANQSQRSRDPHRGAALSPARTRETAARGALDHGREDSGAEQDRGTNQDQGPVFPGPVRT